MTTASSLLWKKNIYMIKYISKGEIIIKGLFKEVNLNAAFSIATEIINIVSSENRSDKMDELLCLDAISYDEFIIKLLNENIDKIMKPSKSTLLHAFIGEFYDMYIFNEFYYFEDSISDSGEFDELYTLLEQVRIITKDCGLNIDDWEQKISELIAKIDLEYEKEEPVIKLLEKEVEQLIDEMRTATLALKDNITENVFFLLFSNKKFLFDFNLMISEFIKTQNLPQEVFNEFNHVIRCSSIPKWLQNGILYRDRATCQQCGADLSNSFQIMQIGRLHFDHIIPLEKDGTNDATNFQLLCADCNLSKNDALQLPAYYYQMYW